MKRYPFLAVLVVLLVLAAAFLIFPQNDEPAIEGAVEEDAALEAEAPLGAGEGEAIDETVEDLAIEPAEIDPVRETAVEEQELLEERVEDKILRDPSGMSGRGCELSRPKPRLQCDGCELSRRCSERGRPHLRAYCS